MEVFIPAACCEAWRSITVRRGGASPLAIGTPRPSTGNPKGFPGNRIPGTLGVKVWAPVSGSVCGALYGEVIGPTLGARAPGATPPTVPAPGPSVWKGTVTPV